MRFVLLHNHIYKNAGSSVDDVFERAGFRNVPLEATRAAPIVMPQAVVDAVLADPSVEYVSSHSFQIPRPRDLDHVGFVDITFIRHPVDRLYSIYTYARHPEVRDFSAIDKSADFPAFVDELARHAPENLHSPQTTCLGNARNFYFPPSAAALERAKRVIAETRFLGVVDLFDQSFATFLACCRALLPGKNLDALAGPFTPVNRSAGRDASLEQRLEEIARMLGPHRLRFVEQANAADLELYRFARAEVLRRYALTRPPASSP